jgi:hypothetical protein
MDKIKYKKCYETDQVMRKKIKVELLIVQKDHSPNPRNIIGSH